MIDRLEGVQNANANANANRPVAMPTATTAPEASPSPFDKASLGINRLAFGAGAIVAEKAPESAASTNGARMLIDESGFCRMTADGQIENQSVTLELPALTFPMAQKFSADFEDFMGIRFYQPCSLLMENYSESFYTLV